MVAAIKNKKERILHPRLADKLREANLFGAFTELTSPRFQKYILQPKHFLRNGWLLAPDLELDQRSVRAYILGDVPSDPERPDSIGQRVEIDRKQRRATVTTTSAIEQQTVAFDLTTMEVISNETIVID